MDMIEYKILMLSSSPKASDAANHNAHCINAIGSMGIM